jgi:hypothetical protein
VQHNYWGAVLQLGLRRQIRGCNWRLVLFYIAGLPAGMTDTPSLRPAEPDEIADALAFALLHDGRRRVHQADSFICSIAAERLVKHLERCGFVVMCKPPAVAPTASGMPLPPWQRETEP